MEDTESCPQYCFSASVEPPGKAHAGLEILLPYLEETVLQHRRRRIRDMEQIGHLSIDFVGVGHGFIP